jgi:hypothetical protein
MTTAKALVPTHLVPGYNTPRCEAVRIYLHRQDAPGDKPQCKLSSRYEVNGIPLCSKHAGVEALRLLLKEQQCKNL